MPLFDQFSDSDRKLLISLPYRVGMWVSHADDVGGEEDDDKEKRALQRIIQAVAKSEKVRPFTKQVAQEILQQKEYWEIWENQIFTVLEDSEKAARLLASNVSEQEKKSYKRMLMKIASVVAGAYGEFGMDAEEEAGVFGKLIKKVTDSFDDPEEDDKFANISAAENAALSDLSDALHLDED